MMPLSEIARMKRTVSEAWESPVADAVAAAWGYPPGAARWWRSSASHVFVLADPRGKRYLRFVPDGSRPAAAWPGVVDLMERLSAGGAAVVRPVPTVRGELTEVVPTSLGPMHGMVVEAAPGATLDVDDLDDDRARAWGRTLAALHRDAADLGAGLPEAFGELAEVPARCAGDPALVEAAARLGDRLAGLPRDRAGSGVVHGDLELDNLAWDAGRATVFDLDEAAVSWYAADVAFALRDLTGPTGHPAPEHRVLASAFVDGYRDVRALPGSDAPTLRLFAGVHAVCALVRIDRALDGSTGPADRTGPSDPTGPDGQAEPAAWLDELRSRLVAMARAHRDLAVAVAAEV